MTKNKEVIVKHKATVIFPRTKIKAGIITPLKAKLLIVAYRVPASA